MQNYIENHLTFEFFYLMNLWSQFLSSLKFDPSRLKSIDLTKFGLPPVKLFFYLDYLNHSDLSGNKIRKLYGTLTRIKDSDIQNIITLGGNYSNYLYACGFLPELLKMNLIVIIKGYEPKEYGYTLNHLKEKGAMLHFYPRELLRTNLQELLDELRLIYPSSYFIPEGGSNEFAHEGFESLVKNNLQDFDIICTPVGTMGTYKGIEKYLNPEQRLLGFAAHLDYSLKDSGNVIYEYAFGGFAKMTKELYDFTLEFEKVYEIPLDPIYTAKMMYGIFQDIKLGKFSSQDKILGIHTGGLQGWNGFKAHNE
jgi:1-aminocyclopropane-1-carboxylate deaminase